MTIPLKSGGTSLQPSLLVLKYFVQDVADRGCCITHGNRPLGTTCIDIQESALRALETGEQPAVGGRWGSEGATGAWRDRVAAGESLCRGCRARRALEGVYVAPGTSVEAR